MQGERDGPVGRCPGIDEPPQDFDVDVLVEGAGEAIAGIREDAPASSGRRRVRKEQVVGGVAQAEDREYLEGPVQEHMTGELLPSHGIRWVRVGTAGLGLGR